MAIKDQESFESKFESWVELYKADPVAFDEMHAELIASQLQKFADHGKSESEITRLTAMIWQQNQQLLKFKDPTARFNKVVELFFVQLDCFNKSLTNIDAPLKPVKKQDNIIKFGVKKDDR